MTLARPILDNQFADVKETLDAALASGGGRLQFPTRGKATQFRHRCYDFRKKYRLAEPTLSIYDRISIAQADDEGWLVFTTIAAPSGFIPVKNGTPVTEPLQPTPAASAIPDDDPLMDAAAIARRSIFGNDD